MSAIWPDSKDSSSSPSSSLSSLSLTLFRLASYDFSLLFCVGLSIEKWRPILFTFRLVRCSTVDDSFGPIKSQPRRMEESLAWYYYHHISLSLSSFFLSFLLPIFHFLFHFLKTTERKVDMWKCQCSSLRVLTSRCGPTAQRDVSWRRPDGAENFLTDD